MNSNQIIDDLFNSFSEIRYVAIYVNKQLTSKQREHISENSSSDTDRYEELLVNPTLLTIARQRGEIDCGGLRFLIVGYGNFFQLIREIKGGHISICLSKSSDLTKMPDQLFSHLKPAIEFI